MEKKKKDRSILFLTVGIVTALVVLVGVFISLTVSKSGEEPEYSIRNGVLSIGGSFGKDIPLSGADIRYIDDSPLSVTKRTNGASVGAVGKGSFTVEGYDGVVYLNVMDVKAPYVRIFIDGNYYFLNRSTVEATMELYRLCSEIEV